ncbi:carbamate kinase [Thalassobaculum sp.]|uniref:carbamate kinase n=1 Tax=Thalassobaculum sp. TaxID=2022740 RepID=UPI0032EF21A4
MLIVVALGGNALLKRGEPMTAERQRANVGRAAVALAGLIEAGHRIVVTHGNGPQVGLLALQSAAGPADGAAYPLDILGAESEGMIGYLIEQELENRLPAGSLLATLLTQVRVDPADPAFNHPTKPIGPVYDEATARRIAAERHWTIAADGDKWRRVVASPTPLEILEIKVIAMLVERGVVVICGGGGGIPVVLRDDGSVAGVEAVIDKDRASDLLAQQLGADMLLMLTDVDAVYLDFGGPNARRIARAGVGALAADWFASGSMRPKIEAATTFVSATGRPAAIGRLEDAAAILLGDAGTMIDGTGPTLEVRP